jgi:hypothetical protein
MLPAQGIALPFPSFRPPLYLLQYAGYDLADVLWASLLGLPGPQDGFTAPDSLLPEVYIMA